MPCKSDVYESTRKEKESVRVLNFLKELGQKKIGKYDSYYGRVETLDEDTARLCNLCQSIDATNAWSLGSKYSLELQIWWRDHQEADRKRAAKALRKATDEVAKEKALAKLSDYEKELLGL